MFIRFVLFSSHLCMCVCMRVYSVVHAFFLLYAGQWLWQRLTHTLGNDDSFARSFVFVYKRAFQAWSTRHNNKRYSLPERWLVRCGECVVQCVVRACVYTVRCAPRMLLCDPMCVNIRSSVYNNMIHTLFWCISKLTESRSESRVGCAEQNHQIFGYVQVEWELGVWHFTLKSRLDKKWNQNQRETQSSGLYTYERIYSFMLSWQTVCERMWMWASV